MKFLKEFKEFAVKGNMIDMAVGIIIGTSFNKVVDALVKEVFLPFLSLFTNGIDFHDKRLVLKDAVTDTSGTVIEKEVAIGYGVLIDAVLDFLIIGLVAFIVVKLMNRLRNKAQDSKDKTVSTPKDIELLSNITELMEEQNKILKEQK